MYATTKAEAIVAEGVIIWFVINHAGVPVGKSQRLAAAVATAFTVAAATGMRSLSR